MVINAVGKEKKGNRQDIVGREEILDEMARKARSRKLGDEQAHKGGKKVSRVIFGKEDSRQREQRGQRHRGKSKVGVPEKLRKASVAEVVSVRGVKSSR